MSKVNLSDGETLSGRKTAEGVIHTQTAQVNGTINSLSKGILTHTYQDILQAGHSNSSLILKLLFSKSFSSVQ